MWSTATAGGAFAPSSCKAVPDSLNQPGTGSLSGNAVSPQPDDLFLREQGVYP